MRRVRRRPGVLAEEPDAAPAAGRCAEQQRTSDDLPAPLRPSSA